MWPLLVCSLASLTISIERILFWRREKRRSAGQALTRIFEAVDAGDFERALRVRESEPDSVGRVLLEGLAEREHGLAESMDVAASEEVQHMRRGLAVLDTIITMAPLLGILGTVLGIIASFELLGSGGIQDPKAVTGGIAQALITTATGLAVALITLVPYNFFVARVESAARMIEKMATRFEMAFRKGRADADHDWV